MCVVSAIGDDWAKRIPGQYPWVQPLIPVSPAPTIPNVTAPFVGVSRDEFEALRRDVQELRKLLIAAKKYDEATGQPDCEVEDKVALIKRIAELVGVDVSDVFPARKDAQ